MSYRPHFSRFLDSEPARLHVAAHSHHPWPDVSFEAHEQAWLDAAVLQDDKWEKVFGEILPEAQGHVARRLGLSDPGTIAFAPSTHELLMRLLSCLPPPVRVLTTDGEFHSFRRQAMRLEEAGLATVERVPVEPFDTFVERFASAAARGGHDVVFLSQVLFDSGFAITPLGAVIEAVAAPETYVIVDGYHGFMARPTDLSAYADRIFYLAGGYKYAMAGEGCCFMHCPPGYAERPVNTGWFAAFSDLPDRQGETVAYAPGGRRFLGGTYDPTGLYRFNAVQRLLDDLDVDAALIHAHVRSLQRRFLDGAGAALTRALIPPSPADRGNFLTFRLPEARQWYEALHARRVVSDRRWDRLRIGFGLYHDDADVDELCARLPPSL